MKMNQYMPEEITVNILSRLPIKSLFRFKCISKPWLNLISDDLCPRLRVAVLNPRPLPRRPFQVRRILGCCNGLLLVGVGRDYLLCNPTTKHCKSIFTLDHGTPWYFYGLCYNSTKDNYIAVVIQHDISEPVGSALTFSVKDKTWNVVKLKDCYNIYSERSGIICNGRLHWLVTSNTGWRRMILCFDPLKEEEECGGFTELDPAPTVGNESSIEGCGVFWESILSVVVRDLEKGHVKVMAMLDQNSWSTMFVIPSDGLFEHFVDTVTPLCFAKEGELIMLVGRSQLLQYCDMKLVAYCPRKRSCWNISPVRGAMAVVETRVASSRSLSLLNAEDKECFIDTQMHNYVSLHSDLPR